MEAEDARVIAEAHTPVHLAPVAMVTPFPAFARVTVSGPAGELVVQDVVQDLEVVFGDGVLEVVGPALDDEIEGVYETLLWCATVLADYVAQVVTVAL